MWYRKHLSKGGKGVEKSMEKTQILSLSALELGRAIKEGKATAVEAMEAVLSRIEEKEELYHCYVTIDRKAAMEQAEKVQTQIEAGELTHPLAGVPVAVKDNLCTALPKYWKILFQPLTRRR